jgi:two-component system OmpR family response regulator
MTRVLIVDDDPISLRFLEAALQQLGCEPVLADSCFAALALAAANRFDLLLLDRNLPDGSGVGLLASLRQFGMASPAIATSAEISVSAEAQFSAAGFAACVEKPVTLTRLEQVLRPWLDTSASAVLDDCSALVAIGGDRAALQALRGMLVQELIVLQADMSANAIETSPLLDRLHRLRASCGFCGTPGLATATIAFEQALRTSPADATTLRQQFLSRCAETVASLTD